MSSIKAIRSCLEQREGSLRSIAGSRREAFRLLYRIEQSRVLPHRVFPITNPNAEPDVDLEFGAAEWVFPQGWPLWARWGRRASH